MHTSGGILVIRTLHVNKVDSEYDMEPIQMSVFKIQLMTECQLSRASLNLSMGGGN